MDAQRPRKYNNQDDLDELCRSFLVAKEASKGAAIEYCRDFLAVLAEKPTVTGAVVSSHARSR